MKSRADTIVFIEATSEIKDNRLPVSGLDDAQEIAELPMEFCPRGAACAIAGEFEIDGRGQGCRLNRYMPNEMVSLVLATSA